uniref:Uncharacterized protein n=1 Tax=Romanomermis culicivorax TaxID=13658 RepID=A0A915IWM3_ROMCU
MAIDVNGQGECRAFVGQNCSKVEQQQTSMHSPTGVNEQEGISAWTLPLAAMTLLIGAKTLLTAATSLLTSVEVTVLSHEDMMTIDAMFGAGG